jgi:hypothetical protein
MLSTHSIFSGLQKTLKDKLTALPPNSDPELVDGLTKAHRKLSDYYYKFDQSPFYIALLDMTTKTTNHLSLVLDPRFNYKKLRKDYAEDPDLLQYPKDQKNALPRLLRRALLGLLWGKSTG